MYTTEQPDPKRAGLFHHGTAKTQKSPDFPHFPLNFSRDRQASAWPVTRFTTHNSQLTIQKTPDVPRVPPNFLFFLPESFALFTVKNPLQTPGHFNNFLIHPQKSPANSTVPLCSACSAKILRKPQARTEPASGAARCVFLEVALAAMLLKVCFRKYE
jgi:hypothetical protein